MSDDFTFEAHAKLVPEGENPNLLVFAEYMKPAHRVERIKFTLDEADQPFRQDFFIPEVRKQEAPVFAMDKLIKVRNVLPFDQNKSVFKNWTKDNP